MNGFKIIGENPIAIGEGEAMPQQDPYGFSQDEVLLEAEVSPQVMSRFQTRYHTATNMAISPGNPPEYQEQPNKWGAECRIYFNSQAAESWARTNGVHVESGQPYHTQYQYRINNTELWWELVEIYQFRLGVNP